MAGNCDLRNSQNSARQAQSGAGGSGPPRGMVGSDVAAARRLVWATALPLVALAVLYAAGVPLGKPGKFTYLYTPGALLAGKLAVVPIALVVAALGALGVRRLASAAARCTTTGCMLAGAALAGMAAWTYFALPAHVNQHVFNFLSPSHDGAFVVEALQIRDLREYLRDFPQRAATPPEVMKGTRVISNPPATTALIYGVRRWIEAGHWPAAGLDRFLQAEQVEPAGQRLRMAVALSSAWLLLALWPLAGVFFWLAARWVLPAPAAAAFALLATLGPLPVLLAPGKDAAQLLLLALLLWLWLGACERRSRIRAACAGVVFVVAVMTSLVFAWLAAIVLVATIAATARAPAGPRRAAMPRIFGGLVGGALVGGALLWMAGLNVPAVAAAVARAQSTVTRGPDAMPLAWQALGIPLFALFAGPATWALGFMPRSRADAIDHAHRFGSVLLIASVLVMLATVGFTNAETPRLWIPFVPLLLLGGLLRGGREALAAPAGLGWLSLLVGFQIAAAALAWAFMDMREAEFRLISGRLFT
jgi:hypothetical protein